MKGLKVTNKKCPYCKIGRVVVNREKHLVFCSVCGHEFRYKS